jgi:hypothetical protein
MLLDTFDRHRGKGMQKITVEHVHVHSGGGQAVVGGVRAKSENQGHARDVTHAPQPARRRADEDREPVPIAGDAEWPLPDARREVAGSTEG